MVDVTMPPTIGAAIGFVTSEPTPVSHNGDEAREHDAHGHELRAESVHCAFDSRFFDVFVLQRFP
jgi:hypothetical protein